MRICWSIFVLLVALSLFGRGAESRQTPQGHQGQIISCSSDDGDKHYCTADTRYGARLVERSSQAPCKEGESWGYDEEGIWVDKGCAGEFTLGRGDGGDASGKGGGGTITCGSDNGRRKVCLADTSDGVQLVRQRSGPMARQIGMAPCTEGSTWGYDRRGVWVDRNCSGEFLVQAGGDLGAGDSSVKSCAKTVGNQVANELVRQCQQVSPATHPPCNAQNSCKLIEGEIQRGCGLLRASAPAFCDPNK
jgi:Protein of unknown function (DUF3011)